MSCASHVINLLLVPVGLGLGCVVLSSPASSQPGRKTDKGRIIAGQVVDDAGKPVAGATVRLVSGPYPGLPVLLHDFLPPRGPALEAVARTDESGRFRIAAKNRHMICLYAEDRAGDTTRMSAPMVPVLPGDYRVVRLRKAAVVRGVVRSSEDDKPMAGVEVHGSIQTPPSSGFSTEGFTLGMQATTGEAGAYTLLVPAGCSLRLAAESGGRYVQKAMITPAAGQDLVFGAGHVMEGVVQGPDGKPVAGALLQDPYTPRYRTRSDATGRFKLMLGANRYWLHVAHPQLAHGADYTQQASRARRAGRVQTKKPGVHVMRLGNGTSVRARVLGPDGQPLARAQVVLGGMARRLDGRGMLSKVLAWPARLDDAGVLDVSCMYKGYVAYVWVEVNGEFVLLFSGDVGSGIDLGDVKLPLAGRLSGVVQLPSRMPAAGVRVLLRRRFDNVPQNLQNMQLPLPFLEVPTDRGGRFRIDGLRPGKYDVAVVAANHFPHLTQAMVTKEEQPLRIALPEGNTMRGKLVDSDDRPVPHRPIRIYMQNQSAQTTYRQWGFQIFEPITDRDGRFVFHGLPDGHMYRVYVYFQIDGQVYRGNVLPNVQPGAQDLELMLTTSMPRVAAGR